MRPDTADSRQEPAPFAESRAANYAADAPQSRLTTEERLMAAGVAGVLLALLGVARWLEPDPSGVGTHTQLGLPPTFVMDRFGTPCPLCGMTTSWAHTMEGNVLTAFLTQPAGALFALVSMLAIPLALVMAATAWKPAWVASPAVTQWGIRWAGAVLAAGWVYKLIAVWQGFPA